MNGNRDEDSLAKYILVVSLCITCILALGILTDDSDASVGDVFAVGGIIYKITADGNFKEAMLCKAGDSFEEFCVPETVSLNNDTLRRRNHVHR